MVDPNLGRVVVYREAKLKSGYAPQYKGYRSKSQRRPETLRAEKLKDKLEMGQQPAGNKPARK